MSLFLAGALAALAAPELAVGYHGDLLTHPGLVARGAWTLAGARAVRLSLEGQALGYWHPGLMTVAQLRGGPALRLLGPRGGTWGAFVHGGVSRGWWTAPTYDVADGEVTRARLAGDTWAVVAGGVELGRSVARGPVTGWAVRPQVGLRVPTFHGVGIDLGVDATARFGGGR